jgi:dihydrofolate synthase/folylpolyglutamate synthase
VNYREAVAWLFVQLPMYQRQGKAAYKADLKNIELLTNHLDKPHLKFKSVHIAGTNGKGSSSHMLASILQEAGYSVGLYTSPHLKDFRERIRINGKMISKYHVSQFVTVNKEFFEKHQLSFFEMTVGLAFSYFAKKKVDIAIVEVGLGGRLDSTNIINPELSLITNIGLDHTQFLGNTLTAIAKEKAGIIKENTPIVISEYQKETFTVFKETAKELNAPLFLAANKINKDYQTDLLGAYQQLNIKGVIQAIQLLKDKGFNISETKIEKGLQKVKSNTGLIGRWDVLQLKPKVVCDTAHNKEGLSIVMKQLLKEKYRRLHIVLGFVNDKDLNLVLPLFPDSADYYFCR